jgi:hypothetical protein
MADTAKCAHPICECMVSKDSEFGKYCSDHCRAAGDHADIRCGCGHPGCE